MKSVIELMQILQDGLTAGSIGLSGGIYKVTRPANSKVEDIVINSLSAGNEQVQNAILNVNVHVPNITVLVNGVNDANQPDINRIDALLKKILPLLKETWFTGGNFELQNHNLIEDNVANNHYVNIRIEFFIDNV